MKKIQRNGESIYEVHEWIRIIYEFYANPQKKPLYLQRSVRCHISEDLSAVRIDGSCFGFGRVTSRFELCFQLAGEFL